MKPEFFRLHLIHPVFYTPAAEAGQADTPWYLQVPVFWEGPENDERLFGFRLDEAAAAQFEPERRAFPGTLFFAGRAVNGKAGRAEKQGQDSPQKPAAGLAAGNYLFTQARELLAKDAIVDLAIEAQQEALWQRQRPAPVWYLRFLFEDGSPVTQILRPLLD